MFVGCCVVFVVWCVLSDVVGCWLMSGVCCVLFARCWLLRCVLLLSFVFFVVCCCCLVIVVRYWFLFVVMRCFSLLFACVVG